MVATHSRGPLSSSLGEVREKREDTGNDVVVVAIFPKLQSFLWLGHMCLYNESSSYRVVSLYSVDPD